MDKEIWKSIEGFPGYEISSLGKVKSLFRIVKVTDEKNRSVPEKIIKTNISKCGYEMVSISFEGKSKLCSVHRLVAQTFIPNPENKPQVNHINGIKTDNSVDNLEWMTQSENQKHAIKMGLASNKKATQAIKKPIICIELDTKQESTNAMARYLIKNHEPCFEKSEGKVSANDSKQLTHKNNKTAYGLTFAFIDKEEYESEKYKSTYMS